MTAPPWSADRPLTAEQARAALETQFPELAPVWLAFVGSGWDNDAYRVNDAWIFRFPRRRVVADDVAAEVAGMELVNEALAGSALATPVFVWRGEPGPHFPYPFLGYRRLPGVGGDGIPERELDRAALARALGDAFGRLHGVELDRARAVGRKEEREPPSAWGEALLGQRELVEGLLPADLRSACAPWLDSAVEPPPVYAGPLRFIHNDVCPDHVLVDPSSGRPTGLIDFADMALGDPALDFVGLWCWLGRAFVEELLVHYPVATDALMWERLGYLARVCSLCWLGDAAREGKSANFPKHRRWVRRAFQLPPSD